MTLRTTVFIATSLDGYIARPDGAIDWLEQANQHVPAGEDCGYAALMATVDLLVMGRGTFEKVLSFPEWPFADKPVWVASKDGPGSSGQTAAAGPYQRANRRIGSCVLQGSRASSTCTSAGAC